MKLDSTDKMFVRVLNNNFTLNKGDVATITVEWDEKQQIGRIAEAGYITINNMEKTLLDVGVEFKITYTRVK